MSLSQPNHLKTKELVIWPRPKCLKKPQDGGSGATVSAATGSESRRGRSGNWELETDPSGPLMYPSGPMMEPIPDPLFL